MVTADQCTICMQALGDSCEPLDCGHLFHTRCVLRWFQQGNSTCPLCRSEPVQVLRAPDVFERCTMLRRKARAKSAPARLKRAVATLQEAERKSDRLRRDLRQWMSENNSTLKMHRKLRRDRWRQMRVVNLQRRRLGLSVFPELPLPLLSRPAFSPY
jgi:hypothetical protein